MGSRVICRFAKGVLLGGWWWCRRRCIVLLCMFIILWDGLVFTSSSSIKGLGQNGPIGSGRGDALMNEDKADTNEVNWVHEQVGDNAIVTQLIERLEKLEQRCGSVGDSSVVERKKRDTDIFNDKNNNNNGVREFDEEEKAKRVDKKAARSMGTIVFVDPDTEADHRNQYVNEEKGGYLRSKLSMGADDASLAYQKEQFQSVFTMIHKQAAMLQDHHSRLQTVSDVVFRQSDTLDTMSSQIAVLNSENERLRAKSDRLQASLDLYQLANDNFVNRTNGLLKKIKIIERNVEGLYADQGTIFERIDQADERVRRLDRLARKLSRRVQKMNSTLPQTTSYAAGTVSKVESAARRLEQLESQDETMDAQMTSPSSLSSNSNSQTASELSRMARKFKKLQSDLHDTTQKLYRLSNFMSDYGDALYLIETGQDVGMRNDEFLADNQRELKIKVKEMETQLRSLRQQSFEASPPDENSNEFGQQSAFHRQSTARPGYYHRTTTVHSPYDTVVREREYNDNRHRSSSSLAAATTSAGGAYATSSPYYTTAGLPSQPRLYPEPTAYTAYGPTPRDSPLGGEQHKVTQYFVTPSPHARSYVTSDKARGVRVTEAPRLSKRTTRHSYDTSTSDTAIESQPRTTQDDDEEDGEEDRSRNEFDQDVGDNKHTENHGPLQVDDVPGCHIKSIGKAMVVALRHDYIAGTWMRDGGVNNSPLYVTTGSDQFRSLIVYNTLEYLTLNNFSAVITLPFHCSGSGHVVYRGSLYCNKKNSNRIMKYNFKTEEVTSVKLDKAGFNDTFSYTTGLATDMDLAVDELGLWLTYGSLQHHGRLALAKLDPDTLSTQAEWVTKVVKKTTLNTFMTCGKLYIIMQDEKTMAAHIPMFFDARTSRMVHVPRDRMLSLDGDSLYLTMVDYNPKDSMIYAWGMNRSWNGQLILHRVTVENDQIDDGGKRG